MPARLLRSFTSGLCLLAGLAVHARGEDPVLVNITGPLAARVGDKVSFEVELVNRSGRPLQGLRVVDYFDKGFHHAASASPIEQRGTIDMAAGTSRRLTLDFALDEPGRQCHRVEILDQVHNYMGGATECVQVAAVAMPQALAAPAVPAPVAAAPLLAPPPAYAPAPGLLPAQPAPVALPQPTLQPLAATPLPPLTATASVPTAASAPALELDLTGPAEVMSGGIAEYVAIVRNKGVVASGPTKLELAWDNSYSPLEASDGYVLGTANVTWNLAAIEPGGQLRRQINLRPQAPASSFRDSPASRACARGVLSGLAGGVMVADEACALIKSTAQRPRTPREAGLRLSIADLDDPVEIGGATTVVCTVSNNGTAPSGRLDLVVVLSDQARLVGDPRPSRVRIDGSTIAFDSIDSLPPGGYVTFEMSYRVPTVLNAKATAILTGAELDGSLESICTTSFGSP